MEFPEPPERLSSFWSMGRWTPHDLIWGSVLGIILYLGFALAADAI